MSFLGNVTIKAKVLIAFASVLIATAGLGAFAITRLSDVNTAAADIRDNTLPGTRALAEISQSAEEFRAEEGAHVLSNTEADWDKQEALLKSAKEEIEKARHTYEPLVSPGEEKELFEKFTGLWQQYLELDKKILALSHQNKDEEAATLYKTEMLDAFNKYREALLADMELNTREANAAANHGEEVFKSARIYIIGALGLSVLLCVGAGFMLIISVSVPVLRMTEGMKRIAGGDLKAEIIGIGQRDEIGQMAGAVQVFKENAIKVEKMTKDQEELKKRAEQEKREAMMKLADEFEASVKGVVNIVASSSTEMQASAQSMASNAEETSRQSAAVSAASEEASVSVQTVASAAEELSKSISEISRQVSQSTAISKKAVDEATHTNQIVQGLAEGAQKIGEVVSLINDIASQTNLLALNATIEAARAGEAGKGFAVVASEVKSLANQTAKATEDISAQINSIQTATSGAVEAIKSIGATISEISEIATTIASAVEEQNAATGEIARSVQQAASGTQEVSSNITGVNQAASEAGHAAIDLLSAAGELSKQSEILRGEVDKFLDRVRAA